jgi:hypothetical protein
MLAFRFDLGDEAAASKSVLLDRLEPVLKERRAAGEVTALVVDEAQSLSVDLLEEIRLLANIETPTIKLLPLVLSGQPELGARLDTPELRQLKQRVTLRCELAPFELSETAAFIASRLTTAGGVPARIFSQEAVMLIHECSAGIPRSISVICDNALVSGMALGRKLVDRSIVTEVCRDLRLAQADREGPTFPQRPIREGAVSELTPLDTTNVEPGADPATPVTNAGPPRRFSFRLGSPVTPLHTTTTRIVTE